MGIALLSFLASLLASPFRSWGPSLKPQRSTRFPSSSVLRAQSRITPQQWAINTVKGQSAGLRLSTPTCPVTPLRVVRLSEAGAQPECAGRMRISGRMADVCAELDRLIAKEAQNLAH
jgi:hypothetical protein